MAKDWGLKITKPGQATTTTDPTKMLFSSAYQMFKYHQDSSVTATVTPGDSSVTVSVTHSLGYVPAFIPYSLYSSDMTIVPSFPYGIGYTVWSQAWADTSKVYFKINYSTPYNQSSVNSTDWFQNYSSDDYSFVRVGRVSGSSRAEGAIRFEGIVTTTSITSATIFLKVAANGGSDRIAWDTYGMDEDNTAAFGSSSPMGRTKTTATVNRNISTSSEAQINQSVEINVLSMVNEIKGRGGWSSGNAMGFLFIENGSTDDNYFTTYGTPSGTCYLRIVYSGNETVYYRALIFKDQIAT